MATTGRSIRREAGPRRELAHRISPAVEVTLYWHTDTDGTSVELRQRATGETFTFAVPRERALQAFYHPFAHLVPTAASLPAEGLLAEWESSG